jgi:RNA polymerase sigma factor (sigma-70 family)
MEDFIHLVYDAQTGDLDAFAQLVARFQNLAYAYAYAILGDFSLAQDAAQEAFIKAYLALPALHEPAAFPAWLKRIIFKYCDRITRRKRFSTIPLDDVEDVVLPRPGPAEMVERSEMSRQVNEALQAIPANLRTVAILFYISGYSQQEIAEFLGVPVKTVKSRLYASRQRLKERMLAMVQDEFAHNPLPEQFTRETVEQALQRAAALNRDRHYEQAETLLRSLLARVPGQPDALKELNRAVMHGRVYGRGRWDLLSELASQGKTILKTSDDEEVHRQVARTLLAIPAMPDAVSFLESWIGQKGADLERLGMLAWARGCSGDFTSSRTSWDDLLLLARAQPVDHVVGQVPFIAYTLVDCLTAAGHAAAAQVIAGQAWETCDDLGPLPAQGDLSNDSGWLLLWHTAGLDVNQIAPVLLARHPESADLSEQGVRLAILSWLNPPEAVAAAWLDWAQACNSAGNYVVLGSFRGAMLGTLRRRGFWREPNRLAAHIWEMLGSLQSPEAQAARESWDFERFNPVPAVNAHRWQEALEIVRAEIAGRGVRGAVGWAAIVAGGSGSPTPVEIVRALQRDGVEQVDEYGMFGWYILAREAAHRGDAESAFDDLRKALSYWSNQPYWISDLWEKDAYWGTLREDARFRQAFDQRRQRIGTIYGWLHYFPGW